MKIHLVVAYSKNRAIGKDNKLLWHLADDMAFFKSVTTGKVVVMGKNTYLSLPPKFRPLPNRINIVLSSQNAVEEKENLYWVKSLEELYRQCQELNAYEIYVIGGGKVYNAFIDYADTIYATEVNSDVHGDTFFPNFDEKNWEKEILSQVSKDEKNDFDFDIIRYSRRF